MEPGREGSGRELPVRLREFVLYIPHSAESFVIFPFFPRGTKTSFPGVKHTKRRVDENERGGGGDGGDDVIDRASANERRRERSMAGAGRQVGPGLQKVGRRRRSRVSKVDTNTKAPLS